MAVCQMRSCIEATNSSWLFGKLPRLRPPSLVLKGTTFVFCRFHGDQINPKPISHSFVFVARKRPMSPKVAKKIKARVDCTYKPNLIGRDREISFAVALLNKTPHQSIAKLGDISGLKFDENNAAGTSAVSKEVVLVSFDLCTVASGFVSDWDDTITFRAQFFV